MMLLIIWRTAGMVKLMRGEPWNTDDPDPSVALSPYTKSDFPHCSALPGSIELYGDKEVIEVIRDGNDYRV